MSRRLKNYIEKDLIKADTGENLKEYWEKVYSNYDDEQIDKAFEEKFDLLDKSFNMIRILFFVSLSNFLFETSIEKLEIYLTHCIVLNNIKENEDFNSLLEKDDLILKTVYGKIHGKIH